MVFSGQRNLTTACSGRAITQPFIINHSRAPLMPGVRRAKMSETDDRADVP